MKIVALILVFLTFSAGSAWAVDTHLESLLGHVPTTTATEIAPVADHTSDHATDTAACDHCCHGSVHLTGLPIYVISARYATLSVRLQTGPIHLPSRHSGPTTPPPLG